MGSEDEVVEIDSLEKGLLSDSGSDKENEAEDERVLYTASFEEMEEKFVKYQTAQWVLYSLLLILAFGLGLFMLLYLPIRRYVLRKDIRSRKLYLTSDSIVYKVNFQLLLKVPFFILFFFFFSLSIVAVKLCLLVITLLYAIMK